MLRHMKVMKKDAIVYNLTGVVESIDMRGLETYQGIERVPVGPQKVRWIFPETKKGIIVLGDGRFINDDGATRPSSMVISCVLTNQVLFYSLY